jgi:predicted amidohydrolase
MRLALWQGTSPASNLDLALIQAEQALKAASALGASALVLPEIWLPGYNQDDIPAKALAQDSPPMQRLAQAARQARCALVVGYAERDGARVYNSAACFGPDGARLANYRKVQLYGPRERAIYTPGDTLATFPIAGETAAILICYDVEFAPHVKALADRGVTTDPGADRQHACPSPMSSNHTVPGDGREPCRRPSSMPTYCGH